MSKTIHRHPALVRRDKAYAVAKPHPRLTDRGKLRMDPMPLAVDLIGVRQMTLAEQMARFVGHGVSDWRMVPDETFKSEEDFLDHLDAIDDFAEDGISPYELAGLRNIEALYEAGRPHIKGGGAVPNKSETGTERAHNAGAGPVSEPPEEA